MIGVVVCAVGVVWLVWASRSDHPTRVVAKPLASAGFLLIVALEPLDDGARATLIVIGLVLGAVGDVALLGQRDTAFLAGLGAFLFGHVAFAAAFGFDQGAVPERVTGAVVGLMLAAAVFVWLRPHLKAPFSIAVPAYILVICVMVALAVGSGDAHPLAAVGAVLFAVSDLFVARERFVHSAPLNPTAGLPLYYGGQVLIAASAVGW